MAVQPKLGPEAQKRALLAEISARIDACADLKALSEGFGLIMEELLRRADDAQQKQKTMLTANQYFKTVIAAQRSLDVTMTMLKEFSKQATGLVVNQRPNRTTPPPSPTSRKIAAAKALSDSNVSAAEVEDPIHIEVSPPPEPEFHGNFNKLLEEAIAYKVRTITRFFQRHNPDLKRELPKPFLLAPEFETKFVKGLTEIIVPRMIQTGRTVSVLAQSKPWETISTKDFWEVMEQDKAQRERLTTCWDTVWGTLRQQRTVKEDKTTGQTREVLVASPALKQLREIVDPGDDGPYDIPTLRNREVELFQSLPFECDMRLLDNGWVRLRQIYEQEMESRWYQAKAREGALRDSLLAVFDALPDRWGDFLAILCYYNFGGMTLHFLERFTHNKGTTQEKREDKVPYLMRFLADPRVPDIRKAELERQREQAEAREKEKKQP